MKQEKIPTDAFKTLTKDVSETENDSQTQNMSFELRTAPEFARQFLKGKFQFECIFCDLLVIFFCNVSPLKVKIYYFHFHLFSTRAKQEYILFTNGNEVGSRTFTMESDIRLVAVILFLL